jgi:hypothetical protein
MKKQITSVLALILLLSALFGCSNALPQNAKTTTATSVITTQEATKKETEKKTETTAETAAAKTTAKAKTTKTRTSTSTTKGKTSTSTTKKKTTAKAQSTCYITIECKSILDNMDKLKEGHEDYVPSNGIILKKTKCTFKNGASVWDILEKVCNDNGIKADTKGTDKEVYVSGINNLDEFDCGKQSGWLYSVNGKFPSFSCGKYTVSNGDEIVFKYVC